MRIEEIGQMIDAAVPKRTRLYVLLGVLALAIVIVLAKAFWPKPAPVQGYVAAVPAHGMASVPLHDVPVAKVKAYDKTAAVKKMGLPADVASDPKKEIISTASIPASEGGYEAATVIDTDTGESKTVIKENERPFLALGGKTEVGARYGLSTRGGEAAALYVRQDIVRVGPAYLAGYGEASHGALSGSEAKGMIDVSVRW